MSNKLFREHESATGGVWSQKQKTPHPGAQLKPGDAALEKQIGLQNFNEKIERWFGSTQQFSERVVRGWKLSVVDSLTYPYTVFCRQCQVYPYYQASLSPMAPLRSIIALHHIAHAQGISAWWRGWNSHMVLQIVHPLVDTVLDRLWGEEVTESGRHAQLKSITRYITLRSVLCALTLPLVSYTYLEMVQNTSHRLYVSFVEVTLQRPWLLSRGSQLLPFSLLLFPTLLHSISYDVLTHLVQKGLHTLSPRLGVPTTTSVGPLRTAMFALTTSFCTSFVASSLLYPLQTVLVRLCSRGIPLLVDCVQSGDANVGYVKEMSRGLLDCARVVREGEGLLGFYKGYSSLLLQYALQGLLLLLLWRLVQTLERRHSGSEV